MTTPAKIGRYEVLSEVGKGGMATVYAAHDPMMNRDVAIKVLPPESLHDPTFRTRFEREAKTVASLENPAIVPVYDYGEADGQLYYVMRRMSGSLAERIKEGPLPPEEILRILSRIAQGLDECHVKGIIHRDLKPANILFDQYSDPYLSDFGIIKMVESLATITGNTIVGTPAYMSPEQVKGESKIDGRSDLYALGVILYQMLAGKVPYEADTLPRQMLKHITEPIPNILLARPDLPAGIKTVIDKAMAKNPADRYQTAKEMTQALKDAFNPAPEPTRMGKPTQPPPPIPEPPQPGVQSTLIADSAPVRPAQPGVQSTLISEPPHYASQGGSQSTMAANNLPPAYYQGSSASGPPAPEIIAPVDTKKRKFPTWLLIVLGLVVLCGLVGLVGGGVGAWYFLYGPGKTAAQPTAVTQIVLPTNTPAPTDLPLPTATIAPPTATTKPTEPPKPTNTPRPPTPKVLFVETFDNKNTNWTWNVHQEIVQLDGNNVVQSSGNGTFQGFFRDYTLKDQTFLQLEFRLEAPNTQSIFDIESGADADYQRFGIKSDYGKLMTQYSLGNKEFITNTLVANLQLSQWYVLKINLDDKAGFTITVFPKDDPKDISTFTQLMASGRKWRFHHLIRDFTAYIDNYSESALVP